MAPPTHRCLAPGCTEQIQQNVVMCREHWAMVWKHHQREVEASWRIYKRARTDEEKWEQQRLYRFAVQQAIRDVIEHIKKYGVAA